MYPVSDEYKQAIAQRNREFKLNAQIYLRDKTILSIGDDELKNTTGDRYVKGDVKIESQMMSGSASDNMIDIGAVPAAKLTMTVFSASKDMHVFSGAYLWLYVSLKLPGGAWEPVPMGKFYINGASISREGNWVSFEAYDGMIKLQYELTDEMRKQLKGKTAMDAAKILCGDQLPLGSAISPAGGYVECPNYELPLNFDSPQIETARDGIMWIAQIMGCFAHVNRLGVLEFVPIKSWWKMYDDTTGTILAVRNIGGGSRFRTRFSDDRIHIVGVTMRGGDGKLVTKRYSYSNEGGDPTSDVTVELETNPLIIGSETPLETILENILSELSTAYFYAFQTEITNDPALDAGDTIRLQGGVINGTNANNDLIGFITHSTWIYRKRQTITNASSVPIVYEDAASGITLMSENGTANGSRAKARAAQTDSDPLNFLPPRSQSDKAQLGGKTDRIVTSGGLQFVVEDLAGNGVVTGMRITVLDNDGALLAESFVFKGSSAMNFKVVNSNNPDDVWLLGGDSDMGAWLYNKYHNLGINMSQNYNTKEKRFDFLCGQTTKNGYKYDRYVRMTPDWDAKTVTFSTHEQRSIY